MRLLGRDAAALEARLSDGHSIHAATNHGGDRGDDGTEGAASPATALLGGAGHPPRISPLSRFHAWRTGAPQSPASPASPTDWLWRSFEEGAPLSLPHEEGGSVAAALTPLSPLGSSASSVAESMELSPHTRRATDDHWAMWEAHDEHHPTGHDPSSQAPPVAATPAGSPLLTRLTGILLLPPIVALLGVALLLFLFQASPSAPAAPPPTGLQKCAELQKLHPSPGTAAALTVAAVRCVGDEAGKAVLAFLKKIGRAFSKLFKGRRAQDGGRPDKSNSSNHKPNSNNYKPDAAQPYGAYRRRAVPTER